MLAKYMTLGENVTVLATVLSVIRQKKETNQWNEKCKFGVENDGR